MSEEFLEKARTQLGELQEKDTHLASTQRGIEELRRQLADEMAHIKAAIDVYSRLMGVATAEPLHNQVPLLADDLRQMTIAHGCEAIMRSQGGEADVTMLLRTLQQVEKVSKSRGSYGTIVRSLSRSGDRFYKVRPGRWGLTEFRGNGNVPTLDLDKGVTQIERELAGGETA